MSLFQVITRRLRWIVSLGLLFAFSLGFGSACTEEVKKVVPNPEVTITPESWVVTEETFPGQKIYKKFVIEHTGKSDPDNKLNIESVQLIGHESFKIYEKCQGTETQGECVDKPSLPQEILSGEKIEFTIEFTATDSADVLTADLIIKTNAYKPSSSEPLGDIKVRLNAQTGEPYIDIALPSSGDKEFRMTFGKVETNKDKVDSFIITNVGNANLGVSFGWDGEAGDYSIHESDNGKPGKKVIDGDKSENYSLIPNDNKEFIVVYRPTTCGDQTARLKVKSNAFSRKANTDTGYSASAPTLYVRLSGSSPAGAKAEPSLVQFQNVKAGESATQTFKISPSDLSLCTLQVFDININASQGQPAPKNLKLGEMRKGGTKIDPPTQAKPIVLNKGEELEVDVTYSPTQQGGEEGVVLVKTNDPDFDPNNQGVVTISAGTEVNLPPRASITFRCQDGGSGNACNKGEDVGLSLFLGGGRIIIELDGSKSYDKEQKIVKYE
ncbi:MAG TPA: hypothetical protein DCE42_27510, partial [Myxococcales bacterium]|nr:hypothetical protein [Myxococcales bacterium]